MVQKGICGSYSSVGSGLYYSSDNGLTWSQSDISTQRFFTVSINGLNAVAGGYDGQGIYYSSNSGVNWNLSTMINSSAITITGTYPNILSITLEGQYGIATTLGNNIDTNEGVYYTSNYGVTWNQSATAGTKTRRFSKVYLNGQNAIIISAPTSSVGIWYSSNYGVTWTQSASYSGSSFESIASNGTIALIGGANTAPNTAAGIYRSTDNGVTWTQVSTAANKFWSISISGNNVIAGSNSLGLYYSNDLGLTWNASNKTSSLFFSVYLKNLNGLAGSFTSGEGLWITADGGVNWTQTNVTASSIRSVFITNNNYGVAGPNFNTPTGIYSSINTLCYEENTRILCLIDGIEKYIKISNMEVGMDVKTYKNGYKKVKFIKGFKFLCVDKNNDLNCLFKMKDTDLIVTGGHSILVDELSEEEYKNNKKYNFKDSIEDKKLLLSCSSNKFEKINDNKLYILYHLVLENEDINMHYGIWVNDGILSESCPEKAYLRFNI
jgi:hypothetical protein